MATLTYLDSGVLIAAARGNEAVSPVAMSFLGAADRLFIASDFVWLETAPKPQYFNRTLEVQFYEAYFGGVQSWIRTTQRLMTLARNRATQFGLNGMDALHIAAAEIGGANEFITTERPLSPLSRVTSIRVLSIHP